VARHLETGEDPPEYARPVWKSYLDWLSEAPPAVRHQRLHGSHYSFVDPDEAALRDGGPDRGERA
jgi:hypothetical protein